MHHTCRAIERMITSGVHTLFEADQLMVEAQENRFAYGALVRALTSLDLERSASFSSRIYEWEMLAAAGFQPELFICTGCGARIEPGQNGLHVEAGGVVCPRCHALDTQSRDISNDALRILRAIGRGEGDRLFGRQISSELEREVEDTLITYLRGILERDLQAYRILKSIEDFPGQSAS
jgi:DNA repair protein RecO (recombination protein O)